jgi:hypothetical protein
MKQRSQVMKPIWSLPCYPQEHINLHCKDDMSLFVQKKQAEMSQYISVIRNKMVAYFAR